MAWNFYFYAVLGMNVLVNACHGATKGRYLVCVKAANTQIALWQNLSIVIAMLLMSVFLSGHLCHACLICLQILISVYMFEA